MKFINKKNIFLKKLLPMIHQWKVIIRSRALNAQYSKKKLF